MTSNLKCGFCFFCASLGLAVLSGFIGAGLGVGFAVCSRNSPGDVSLWRNDVCTVAEVRRTAFDARVCSARKKGRRCSNRSFARFDFGVTTQESPDALANATELLGAVWLFDVSGDISSSSSDSLADAPARVGDRLPCTRPLMSGTSLTLAELSDAGEDIDPASVVHLGLTIDDIAAENRTLTTLMALMIAFFLLSAVGVTFFVVGICLPADGSTTTKTWTTRNGVKTTVTKTHYGTRTTTRTTRTSAPAKKKHTDDIVLGLYAQHETVAFGAPARAPAAFAAAEPAPAPAPAPQSTDTDSIVISSILTTKSPSNFVIPTGWAEVKK
jgi:hypothetical protein